MQEKIDGLETEIGARGSAEIHSGKRSALRAWVMAKTGLQAVSILKVGTARLGEAYNDTTNGILDSIKGQAEAPDSRPAPSDEGNDVTPGNEGKAETPAKRERETPAKNAPKPVKPSGNAMEDRVREIAREEDATVIEQVTAEMVRFQKHIVENAPAPSLDEARVREIALDVAVSNQGVPATVVLNGTVEAPVKIDVGACHRMFPLLLASVRAGLTPALVGPAGSGKTHGAHAVARALARNFEMQGTCTTASAITGYQDGYGKYQATPFYRAFKNGGVFLGDEMDAWHANAALAMNAGLSNGHAAFPEGLVERHELFSPIMALNTYGTGASRQYVGRNQMDAATLNRLAFIAWDYDEALEAALVGVKRTPEALDISEGGTPTPEAWVKRVQAVRRAVESLKVRHIVSPRATIGGVKLFAVGVGQKWAEEMLIWQGMDAEQRARIEGAAK